MHQDHFERLGTHEKLNEIYRAIRALAAGEEIIMSTQAEADVLIAALRDEVAKESTVDASAIALLNGIPKLIEDAVAKALAANPGVDLSALTAVSATIAANRQGLADAVTAGTPAAPPAPAPGPAPDPTPAPVPDPAPPAPEAPPAA